MSQIEVLYIGGPMDGHKSMIQSPSALTSAVLTQPDRITLYERLLVMDDQGAEVTGWYVMECVREVGTRTDDEIRQRIYAANLQPVVQGFTIHR